MSIKRFTSFKVKINNCLDLLHLTAIFLISLGKVQFCRAIPEIEESSIIEDWYKTIFLKHYDLRMTDIDKMKIKFKANYQNYNSKSVQMLAQGRD